MSDRTAPDLAAQLLTVLTAVILAAVTASGRTVAALAAAIGVEPDELSCTLNGRRELFASEMIALAEVLGVRASAWLTEAERLASPLHHLAPGDRVRFRVPAGIDGSAPRETVGTVLLFDVRDGSAMVAEDGGDTGCVQPFDLLDLLPADSGELDELAVHRIYKQVAGVATSEEERERDAALDAAIYDGRACVNCGRIWAVGESSRPAGIGSHGQLFRCGVGSGCSAEPR
ncbi:hypothetical protein [Nocardia sp. MW-W600-9]